MNKAQLIEAMAKKAGLTKVDTKKALDALIETATETLQSGEKIALIGFGSFSTLIREAREGRNPQTGKSIHIPEKTVIKFKPSGLLTDDDGVE